MSAADHDVELDRLLGDDPVDGSDEAADRLDRQQYVDHVVDLLDQVRLGSESSVLAMIGPWGAGKSSALAMMKRELQSKAEGWLVGEFNPWVYSDLESMQLGFFSELRDALPGDAKWSEARKRISDFGKAVSPLGKVGALIGLDLSGAAEAISSIVGGDVSASATRGRAAEALQELDRPILMILDDLDRLSPTELLLVLKLVRLNGRLPNVYYMLAYDERTMLDVLMRTELVKEHDESRARDYLEKIVQVRLDIPALRDQQKDELIDRHLSAMLKRHDVHLGVSGEERLGSAYHDNLRRRLDTPRAIIRFLAQVDAFYGAVHGEVDFVDFMLVTWIRTAEPGLYKLLQQHRAELTHTDIWLQLKTSRKESDLERWREALLAAAVDSAHVEGILGLLGTLFVPIRTYASGNGGGQAAVNDIGRRKGVGHVDYFDRYFSFGVPREDIADSAVLATLGQLKNPDLREVASVELAGIIIEQPEKMLAKIEAFHLNNVVPVEPMLEILAASYHRLPLSVGVLAASPHRTAAWLSYDLFAVLDDHTGSVLVEHLAATASGIGLMEFVWQVHVKAKERGDVSPIEWFGQVPEILEKQARQQVQALSAELANVPERQFGVYWVWREFNREQADQWLSDRVSQGWNLLEVLARLVPQGTTNGRPALGDMSLATIDEIFGVHNVLADLSADIAGAVPVHDTWSLEPTAENRRNVVLWTLHLEQQRRRTATPATAEDVVIHESE